MTAPIASGWSESPGGTCTHWKAPPCHGAHPLLSFSPILKRLSHGPGEHVGLAVQRRDQAINAVSSDDCAKFGATGRHFAYRAVEVDVGNQPTLAVAAHHVIDLDRLAVGLDNLALHQHPAGIGLFAGYLQFLPGI